MTTNVVRAVFLCLLVVIPAPASAHDGPPFPVVSDRVVGPYRVSLWTDPDTTDDGSAGGQFWVRLNGVRTEAVPEGTRALVSVTPLERKGPRRQMAAAPVRGNIGNQFAAVLMDHEGRFAVQVAIDGPLGRASVDAEVDATYDLRPPPILLILYALPFLAVGLLWGRLIASRKTRTSPGR